MGETLQMASDKGAYALTDEGTYLAYKGNLTLVPQITKGASLLNIYSVMAVYNDKQPVDKIQMANNFINFLISPQTQADIGAYGVDKYGKSLFIPMSVSVPTATAGWVGDYSTPATDLTPAPVVSCNHRCRNQCHRSGNRNHSPCGNSNNLIISLFSGNGFFRQRNSDFTLILIASPILYPGELCTISGRPDSGQLPITHPI